MVISFIHSGYFYNTSSSALLLGCAPDTAQILCRSFTPKRHRQLRVKDLPKVPTWQLGQDSSQWYCHHFLIVAEFKLLNT